MYTYLCIYRLHKHFREVRKKATRNAKRRGPGSPSSWTSRRSGARSASSRRPLRAI